MSRSRKKHPITGIACSQSERKYKKQRAGEERARARQAISRALETMDDNRLPPLSYELSPWDEWATARDGKFIFDPKKHPKLMRK